MYFEKNLHKENSLKVHDACTSLYLHLAISWWLFIRLFFYFRQYEKWKSTNNYYLPFLLFFYFVCAEMMSIKQCHIKVMHSSALIELYNTQHMLFNFDLQSTDESAIFCFASLIFHSNFLSFDMDCSRFFSVCCCVTLFV